MQSKFSCARGESTQSNVAPAMLQTDEDSLGNQGLRESTLDSRLICFEKCRFRVTTNKVDPVPHTQRSVQGDHFQTPTRACLNANPATQEVP